MINRIGQDLGLLMNDVALLKVNGQIRFLSRFFLKTSETLVHGAEISGEYLDDMELAAEIANEKATSRELFTFEFIQKAIRFKFKAQSETLIHELVKMVAFDCLVGNNDRHLSELTGDGVLKKVGPGLYHFPKKNAFGFEQPADQLLIKKFLDNDNFLITSFNSFNALGVGTTQLYNKQIVYNHQRSGDIRLGNKLFSFKKKIGLSKET